MKLLLDGDLFAYRCAASAENTEAHIAEGYIDKLLDQCILELGGTEYQFYLTGSNNFRFNVYPEYKANRLDTEKPRHLAAMREYLMTQHNAIMSEGCEADDLMGIAQCQAEEGTTTIVSLDKDMLMIPGNHYSWHIEGGTPDKRWVKEAKRQLVEPLEGLRWFYTQLLTGDPSDNIKGCPGVGKVGAKRMLQDVDNEQEMFNRVRDAYSCDEAMLMNGQCLWIMRKKETIWEFPFETDELQ
jgi:5'-3' exonuclease